MAASMVMQQLTSLKVVPSMHNLSARRSSLNSAGGVRIPKASTAQSLKMAGMKARAGGRIGYQALQIRANASMP
jgi:hypothetical protein